MGSVPRHSVCGSTPSFASLGAWCGKGSAPGCARCVSGHCMVEVEPRAPSQCANTWRPKLPSGAERVSSRVWGGSAGHSGHQCYGIWPSTMGSGSQLRMPLPLTACKSIVEVLGAVPWVGRMSLLSTARTRKWMAPACVYGPSLAPVDRLWGKNNWSSCGFHN